MADGVTYTDNVLKTLTVTCGASSNTIGTDTSPATLQFSIDQTGPLHYEFTPFVMTYPARDCKVEIYKAVDSVGNCDTRFTSCSAVFDSGSSKWRFILADASSETNVDFYIKTFYTAEAYAYATSATR